MMLHTPLMMAPLPLWLTPLYDAAAATMPRYLFTLLFRLAFMPFLLRLYLMPPLMMPD